MPVIIDELPQAFRDWLGDRPIEEVECIVSDLAGIARGKAMPWKKFIRGGMTFLPASIFYQTITGDWTDIEGMEGDQWTEADMVLTPDLTTGTAAPWASDVTLQVIHDVTTRSGEPVAFAPRNVLKRVLSFFEAEGWRPVVAPELEFYLTKPNVDPDHPIEPPIGRTGRKGIQRQAYSMSAVDEYGSIIEDIYDFAEAQGFEIDTIIQEGGAGQIEINFGHGDPLALADQIFFFKRSIREAALRHDCFATFMAKPMEGQPGSAMHIHQSVVDAKTGDTIFSNADGSASALFNGFLGGQQQHLASVLSILAPYVNSYRRFVADDAAPVNLEWASDNRTVGLRIPLSDPEARRVENRVAGMDCNSYLGIAASLAAGYLGMKNAAKPREPISGVAYDLPHALPRDLWSALYELEKNEPVKDILGQQFCRVFAAIKKQEIEEFLQVISPWEREHLLLNV